MATARVAPSPAETTDLERRVLAHERILQSLIAYMSRTEPRFVDHLRDRFVEPMKMARHEHDYRDVDDYAEEFIRAVILMGEKSKPAVSGEQAHDTTATVPIAPRAQPSRPKLPPDRIQLKETGGIWHITVDGAFWGDFHRKEQALAAMALAKLSLR
jgi:CubicO group peptidase (beta-lactamase class C family)